MKHIYNPEGFDPRNHLPVHLHKQQDAARYLVHIIEANRVFSKRPRDGWTNLKADYLMNMMGRNHMIPIREALEDAKVIECDHDATEGVKSFGFRLGPMYQDAVFRPIPAGARLQKRARKHRMQVRPTLPVHKHLYRWLKRLGIDYDAAMNSFPTHKDYIDKHLAVELINDGHVIFIADPYGRVHTQFTFLASTLRQHCHFNGERLVSYDICNAQPFFLSLMLLKSYSEFEDFGNVYQFITSPKQEEERGGRGRHSITTEIISLLRCKAMTRLDLPQDVNEYISLTERGQIYEYCMELFDIDDREESKHALFKCVLFNRDYYHKPPKRIAELRARFNDEFPNVYSVVSRLKRKDYRHISHALQRFESAVMIHQVCGRLMREFPHVPVLTVHDCLYTTREHLDVVGELLTDEFKTLALSPTFKVVEYAA